MPYAVGLHSALSGFLPASFLTQFTIAVIGFLLIVSLISALQRDDVDTPVKLPGHPFLAIFPFFRQRFDFLNWGFQVTGQPIFQFQLLRVR